LCKEEFERFEMQIVVKNIFLTEKEKGYVMEMYLLSINQLTG